MGWRAGGIISYCDSSGGEAAVTITIAMRYIRLATLPLRKGSLPPAHRVDQQVRAPRGLRNAIAAVARQCQIDGALQIDHMADVHIHRRDAVLGAERRADHL